MEKGRIVDDGSVCIRSHAHRSSVGQDIAVCNLSSKDGIIFKIKQLYLTICSLI